jgi:hypothetical protein
MFETCEIQWPSYYVVELTKVRRVVSYRSVKAPQTPSSHGSCTYIYAFASAIWQRGQNSLWLGVHDINRVVDAAAWVHVAGHV